MNIRLDRFLSENTSFSRNELKKMIRERLISVNGTTVNNPDLKIDSEESDVRISGKKVERIGDRCFMMNKPAGYVTSTDDPDSPIVTELIPSEIQYFSLVPIGRLDKDTEGLLLFTNNGELSHRLTSPKYNIEKCYYAEHEGAVTAEDVIAFSKGLTLRDGLICKSARLESIEAGKAYIYLTEGKYHQVRRMMAARGHHVLYLKRLSLANILLGELPKGTVRELTVEEYRKLKETVGL